MADENYQCTNFRAVRKKYEVDNIVTNSSREFKYVARNFLNYF